jgi:hypothetical protein
MNLEESRLILLPTDPGFADILSLPPPGWRDKATGDGDSFIARSNQGGILDLVSWDEAMDYVWGGELEELEESLGHDAIS